MGVKRGSSRLPGIGRTARSGPTHAGHASAIESLRTIGSDLIMTNFPQGVIVVFDHDLRYICAGGTALANVGLSRAVLEGNTIEALYAPEVVAAIEPAYRLALAGQESLVDVDYEGRIFLQQLGPLRDASGDIVAGMGFTWDVTETRRIEREREVEHQRSNAAQSAGGVGSWDWDITTGILSLSDTVLEMYGLGRAEFGDDFAVAMRCLTPDDRRKVRAAIEGCVYGDRAFEVRYRVRRANDASVRWIDARGERVFEDDRLVRLSGVMIDVTDQVDARAAADEVHDQLERVLTCAPDCTFVLDVATGAVVYGSREKDVLGFTAEAVEAFGTESISSLVHPDDQADLGAANLAAADLADGEVLTTQYRGRDIDGKWHWLSRRVSPFQRDAAGNVIQIVGSIRDVTEIVEAENRARYAALHDGLTGLPNRTHLIERLEAALLRSEQDGRDIAVLYCDLDGFKRINDTAGHAAGDAVLVEIARRLQHVMRSGDTIARVGGDEFVMLVEPWNRDDGDSNDDKKLREHRVPEPGDSDDRALAVQMAERVAEILSAPVVLSGSEHVVTASVGITFSAPPGEPGAARVDARAMVQDADAAMYRAKAAGKDRAVVFESGRLAGRDDRANIEKLLCAALNAPTGVSMPASDRASLTASYQPIFASRTGRLVGFEALARLTDAQGDQIAPELFIAVAEDTGLIHPLGKMMLDLACGQLASWRTRSSRLDRVTMAVNISASQLRDVRLADDVIGVSRYHHLEASDLVLEVSETALLEAAPTTLANLRDLRRRGVGVSIDRFGASTTSLPFLASVPVSGLKVDRSLAAGLPGEVSCKIVNAMASLAANLSLDCVIAGVETAEQRAALPRNVQLQGWLTGRPEPPEAIDRSMLLVRRKLPDRAPLAVDQIPA